MSSLIEITTPDFDVDLEIAYATPDNVTGKPLYSRAACFLHKEAAQALIATIGLTAPLGYRIKIFDAFRPLEAQQMLWDHTPDATFVSPPDTGVTPHCRGVALDMTLIDSQGNALDMGTGFDAFTPLSYHGNLEVSAEAQKNRHLLMGIMTYAGWRYNPREWWHYQLPNAENYPKLSDKKAGSRMIL
jgi:D-alanyl-D-alanine dipeptidase